MIKIVYKIQNETGICEESKYRCFITNRSNGLFIFRHELEIRSLSYL